MITAHDAQPACRQGGAYIQTIITVLIWKTNNGMWPGKKHIELFRSVENQLVQVYRDKNMIRAYVNTPATAKIAIGETNRYVHPLAFSFLPQKTQNF